MFVKPYIKDDNEGKEAGNSPYLKKVCFQERKQLVMKVVSGNQVGY